MNQATSTRPAPAGTALKKKSGLIVLALCFVAIVFDGYDLVVYGSTVPSILGDESWDVDPNAAGVYGSLALLGMLIGTLFVGLLTDVLGRKKIMIISLTWFSVLMGLTAIAPSPEIFGLLRFLTGLGLGPIIPSCVAMTVEFAPRARRQLANAVMYSGYSVGGVLAALLGIVLLPHVDWRWLYAFGALPVVVLVPFIWAFMPESVAYLAARGRHAEARRIADDYGLVYADVVAGPAAAGTAEAAEAAAEQTPEQTGSLRLMFSHSWILGTFMLAFASYCGLLLVYGLNTWLPQIMREAGYDLGSSLSFLLALNVGAIVGAISGSYIADRIGIKKVVLASFAIAFIAIALMSFGLPYGVLLVFIAFAGLGSIGTQIFVNGFVATYYPQANSATALAWTLGVGRLGGMSGPIIGGLIASLALGFQVNFYIFAAVALVGAVLIALVPRRSAGV
ncbi:aromatic acid/H+ symport family MFS transporter [Leucobacter sp. CSA1]|uniref:Aromatic acid/H+ symport family MFS transporter n=1 Tax=Leucobacter chromiisoli TaxID=2796471 RepID=A0A934QA21_9MICO|nr:aromatic acid/H+ symport family MFS transporter [Leucobacter chromiisoli]MBK0420298.1 aromatic acid/H+ symport family MFS transporter [Leucobacter chromiisoli]